MEAAVIFLRFDPVNLLDLGPLETIRYTKSFAPQFSNAIGYVFITAQKTESRRATIY
jgi:hypothetical protein